MHSEGVAVLDEPQVIQLERQVVNPTNGPKPFMEEYPFEGDKTLYEKRLVLGSILGSDIGEGMMGLAQVLNMRHVADQDKEFYLRETAPAELGISEQMIDEERCYVVTPTEIEPGLTLVLLVDDALVFAADDEYKTIKIQLIQDPSYSGTVDIEDLLRSVFNGLVMGVMH